MANLTDFLEPQLVNTAETVVRSGAKFKEWEELRETSNSFLLDGIFTGGAFSKLSPPEKDIISREERLILGIWQENKFLPVEMVNSALGEVRQGKVVPHQRKMEPLVRFSALPKTRLSNIRAVAERLSFAIVPYDYIDQDGIVQEYADNGQRQYSREIREGFKDVNELYRDVSEFEEIDLYILCPVNFYDPWQEVKDEQTRQKIFGGELSQVAMTLGMLMPTQKNLFQMSKVNAENLEALNKTMNANFGELRKTLDSMQGQISWLAELVGQARREAAQAASEAKAAMQEAKQMRYRLATFADPLIFAVSRGTDLYDDDVDARLLMCFGADMPLDFFLNRGLMQVDGNGYYDPIVKVCK